jgi:exopolysaccharide production protein ExoZ
LKAVRDQEYYGLQALRAIAALAVVAGHTGDYLLAQNGTIPAALAWIHGPAGVDLFFVISGFVMTISSGRLLQKANPARIFLWRRILRIVPLYWIFTTLKLVLVTAHPSLSTHAKPSLWNIVSSYLFIPSRGMNGDIRPVIVVGWTLSFEMLFYVLFALSLLVGRERIEGGGRRGLVRFLVVSVGLVALLGLFRTDSWPAWTAFADPIVLEFLAGVGIARLALRGCFPGKGVSMALVGMGVAALILLLPGGSILTTRALVWGVPAGMIVLGLVALESTIVGALPKWLLLLGDASYSIYLVQTFVLPELHIILDKLRPGMVHERPLTAGLVLIAAGLVTTSVAGVVSYLLLERQIINFLKRSGRQELVAPVLR